MSNQSDKFYQHKIVPLDNFRRHKYNQYVSLYKESVRPPIVIEGNGQQKMFHKNIPLQYAYKYSQNPQVVLHYDYSRRYL
jgi:hypothetical protein